jgi:hypothetical protein
VPYLTTFLNGTVQPWPLYNTLASNFFVAGGGANGGTFDKCVRTRRARPRRVQPPPPLPCSDDGSSRYNITGNFQVYGGHKSDFNGHQKVSTNNVMAFAYVYGYRCAGIFGNPTPGFNEGYANNTCLLSVGAGTPYLDLGSNCDVSDPSTITVTTHNNAVYAPDDTITVSACGKSLSFAQWMQLGIDAGSTLTPTIPPTTQIIAWARNLLLTGNMHDGTIAL